MVFLVYKERARQEDDNSHVIERCHTECFLEVVGIITGVDSLWNACERLGLCFSMPAAQDDKYIMLVEAFKRVAYKKSHRHKTRYFLREMTEATEEMIRFPQKRTP